MGKNVVSTIGLSVLVVVLCEISCGEEYYTNQWAVHAEGGEEMARHLADKHGFIFVDTVRLLLLCLVEHSSSLFFIVIWFFVVRYK